MATNGTGGTGTGGTGKSMSGANGGPTGPYLAFDPGEFTKLSSRNLEMATRAARAYFNGAARLNQEVMGFVNSRMKKDIETAQSVMTSKTGEEALHNQAQFFEGALRDYADEASKILHLAADLARETLGPVEARAEEVLHEIDARADKPRARSQAGAA